MKNTLALNKNVIKTKSLFTLGAILCAVALPQVFHYLGVLSGMGPLPGAAFLPMHIPVFIAAFMAGPVVGVLAGALSPLFSYVFTLSVFGAAMPALPLLPFMTLELAIYGLVAGMLYNKKASVFLKLVTAQLAGRIIRLIAVVIATASFGSALDFIIAGLPGIMLQWALIPLLIYRVKGLRN
jgi:uncharacterized membrane protein